MNLKIKKCAHHCFHRKSSLLYVRSWNGFWLNYDYMLFFLLLCGCFWWNCFSEPLIYGTILHLILLCANDERLVSEVEMEPKFQIKIGIQVLVKFSSGTLLKLLTTNWITSFNHKSSFFLSNQFSIFLSCFFSVEKHNNILQGLN